MQPPVAVIIVAWNQMEITLECLASVAALEYPAVHTILVDNGSEPPLEPSVRPRFPGVEVLRLERNLGFAGGYNAGLRRAMESGYRLLFLLNNDALPAAASLGELVDELQSAADVALVTAKIHYAAAPERIWTVGNDLNVFLDLKRGGQDEIDSGQWDTPRDIDFAPFCGVVLRAEAIERVGLLDEAFFLYYEDMDYCRRLREADYRLRCRPSATIRHAVSTSTGGRQSPTYRYYLAQSGGRYFRKHGRGLRLALIVPFRAASTLKMTVRLLLAGDTLGLRAYWAGLWAGWRTGRADTPPPAWVRGE